MHNSFKILIVLEYFCKVLFWVKMCLLFSLGSDMNITYYYIIYTRVKRRKIDFLFSFLRIKVMCNHNFNIFLNQDSNIYSEKKFVKAFVHVNTICRFFSGKFYGYLRELYLLEK